jgi:alpha-L-rhamnosidase
MRTVGLLVLVLMLAVSAVWLSGCKEEGVVLEMKEDSFGASAGAITADYLRCEYMLNPLGIDIREPRLSWLVKSAKRGQEQTAYHILVAGSEEKLTGGKGDLWDSGKVLSDNTTGVVYRGAVLKSRLYCYWKVKVWDKDGKESAWSEPAMWSMGLLNPSDWKGLWIGLDDKSSGDSEEDNLSKAKNLDDCKWVWYPAGDPKAGVAGGIKYFRRVVRVGARIKRALFLGCVDNRAEVFVNGGKIGDFSGWQAPKAFDVTEKIIQGKNLIAVAATNEGDTDNPAGLLGKLLIEFEDGRLETVKIDATWKVCEQKESEWKELAFDDSGWESALEFAEVGQGPWGKPASAGSGGLVLPAPSYLRKSFTVGKEVKRAVMYATALGIYEVRLNGSKVGSDYFTPGWTDYEKRIYYNTYDVTEMLRQGGNAIGAIVADGWYAGYVGYGNKRNHYGEKIRFKGKIHIDYTDGTSEIIAADSSWKASTGPLLEADFLMGETFDAQKQMAGWDRSGFDESAWKDVDVTETVAAVLQAYPCPTVQKFTEIKPVNVNEPKEGAYVYDMGTNFAGFAKLKVKGKSGDKVVLRFAERLNPDGTIYTTNLRSARATDTYICSGEGEEIWHPRFTFHGFQYVELTGYPGRPTLDTITGIELTSATPPAGSFKCSQEMANQLYRNICQTQRANFIDIPTDCPQRDERLGWTGDAQVYIRTASMNCDTQAFFTKWLVDLTDAQRADGQFPMVAPLKVAGGDGGPAWADAGVICPWTVYEVYGDKRILAKHYDSMVKFVEFCKGRCTQELLPPKEFHCFGDWLNINDDTPKDVIFQAYFACSTRLLSKAAQVLGKEQDAKKYEELFEKIKVAFNKAYVTDDGKVKGDSQTCYVLALAYDLVDGQRRDGASARLIEKIKERNWHLSTGFVGTKDLMLVLTKIGRNDVAYRLFGNDTFPSWGFSIKHGATSIWERWDGWTPDKGFQDPGMNSFAHYSFGAVGQWMFENIGGINSDAPGFKGIIIRPRIGGNLTYAKTNYNSIRGLVGTDWRLKGDDLLLDVIIPANTTATIYVPAAGADKVTESGVAAGVAEGVEFIGMEQGTAVYKVGSGIYSFVSKDAKAALAF